MVLKRLDSGWFGLMNSNRVFMQPMKRIILIRFSAKKNLSFYCRLDAQREANEKQVPVRCNLTNGEFVWAVPMSFLAEFLMYIEDYFTQIVPSDYEMNGNVEYSIEDEKEELFSVDINDVLDETGKIIAIKNPAVIKDLKEARKSGKPFAEYDILYKYYADKIAVMNLAEWTQLLNSTRIDEA